MTECKHREGCDPTKSDREPIKNKAGEPVDAHDCDYVNARNRLIPRAEAEASRHTSVTLVDGPAKDMAFGRVFMATMDRLAAEAGLVDPLVTTAARAAA